jgi:DNA gyrase/topoisomerase IV subunit A
MLDAFEKTSLQGLVIASLDKKLLASFNGMVVRFLVSTLRPTGRTSRGVVSMKLREGDTIADIEFFGA